MPGLRRTWNRKRLIGLFLALAAVTLAGIAIAVGALRGPSNQPQPSAPDFTVATQKGEFRLSQQQGKVVVLYFSFPG